jgi:hypothetical protein
VSPWTTDNTQLDTWFERDRALVSLSEHLTGRSILDVRDEAVAELVEDGFLDPRAWHRSAVEYANHLGLRAISDEIGTATDREKRALTAPRSVPHRADPQRLAD